MKHDNLVGFLAIVLVVAALWGRGTWQRVWGALWQ